MKAIVTKYVGPSNVKGSRIIASDKPRCHRDSTISKAARRAFAKSVAAGNDLGVAEDDAREVIRSMACRTGHFDAESLTWTSDKKGAR